jgi:hypothetical protein
MKRGGARLAWNLYDMTLARINGHIDRRSGHAEESASDGYATRSARNKIIVVVKCQSAMVEVNLVLVRGTGKRNDPIDRGPGAAPSSSATTSCLQVYVECERSRVHSFLSGSTDHPHRPRGGDLKEESTEGHLIHQGLGEVVWWGVSAG